VRRLQHNSVIPALSAMSTQFRYESSVFFLALLLGWK
jgi:hypothetical protein